MKSNTPTPRHRILKWLIIVFVLLIAAITSVVMYIQRFTPLNRDWVVKALEDRYDCQVELKTFSASVFPVVRIHGEGMVLRRKNQLDLPPLASIAKFSIESSWRGLLRHPRHFTEVRLEGMVLNVPPRQSHTAAQPQAIPRHNASSFILDKIFADGTTVNIFSAKPGKPPRDFDIQKLRLQSAGLGQPLTFQATLTNPKPVGQIQSRGRFGPWEAEEPALTPVQGSYTFRDANLSTIHGISGILSSKGTYDGVLNEIKVQGETDTPDFALGISGNQMHLKTQFSAVVDGTNSDTYLQPVNAQLGASKIVCRGEVTKAAGGRNIALQVKAGPARLEDLLRLAVKSGTPLIGPVIIETRLEIPPGDEDIARKLKLDGTFVASSARIANREVEGKITELSRRGQGTPGDFSSPNPAADMRAHFVLENGVLNFSSLSFSVAGATVHLQGTFELVHQTLDFHGTLNLEAKISQTVTGIKSILLKPIDPLFKGKNGGSVLPIKITGTTESPSFGLEMGKVFHRSK